jgi:hypothetical protein
MPPEDTTIPLGLCQCGCGGTTSIAKCDWPEFGHVKGQPKRFLRGHRARLGRSPVEWIEEDRGHETPCWIWQRAVNTDTGYGTVGGLYAHRIVYERLRGPVPGGMQLDHLCRQRSCVNPDHVEPVTNAENTQRGSQAKLTPALVREIRALRGTESAYRIARRLGVGATTVYAVWRGVSWANVE